MESACKLQVGRDRYDGKVRMEADHIDFAGCPKYRFRLSEIRSPRQDDDTIIFDFHGSPVSIKLGSGKAAGHWIDYILHPQTLVDKLGVKEGHCVRLMNLDDHELMGLLQARNATIVCQSATPCDLVMLGVERPSELRQIEDLSETLRPDGAIWVVLPKSVRTVSKANVFAAAREAGLNQVEIVDYSETQAAYKIVRPRSMKKRAGSASDGSADRAATAGRPASR
jgi:hypothetical protein